MPEPNDVNELDFIAAQVNDLFGDGEGSAPGGDDDVSEPKPEPEKEPALPKQDPEPELEPESEPGPAQDTELEVEPEPEKEEVIELDTEAHTNVINELASLLLQKGIGPTVPASAPIQKEGEKSGVTEEQKDAILKFVDEDTLRDSMTDPDSFNKLMTTIYRSMSSSVQAEIAESQRREEAEKQEIRNAANLFYAGDGKEDKGNPDLVPYYKLVAYHAKIAKDTNKDITYADAFTHAGKEVRESLKLAQKVIDAQKSAPGNGKPTNKSKMSLPGVGTKGKRAAGKDTEPATMEALIAKQVADIFSDE